MLAFIDSAIIGTEAALRNFKWNGSTDWYLSLDQRLPFATFTGLAMLQIRLHMTTICWSVRLRNGSGAGFARYVTEEHPLIVACQVGDVDGVRVVLGSREGFVTDTTVDNKGPLAVRRTPLFPMV